MADTVFFFHYVFINKLFLITNEMHTYDGIFYN